MRRIGPRWLRAAAWLGVFALGLNALVPIHLAFDLAEALEPLHRTATGLAGNDPDQQLLGLICGHRDDSGEADHHGRHDDSHHHADCPVCSAVGTLAALALPTAAVLPVPAAMAAPRNPSGMATALAGDRPAAYRSRAPPVA
jgi:hypothetical protein